MRLMVVSGRSGSGKSVALRVLEDLGYYCVDNLPVNLLTQFIETIGDEQQDVAVSLDVRNMPSDTQALEIILNDLSNKVILISSSLMPITKSSLNAIVRLADCIPCLVII